MAKTLNYMTEILQTTTRELIKLLLGGAGSVSAVHQSTNASKTLGTERKLMSKLLDSCFLDVNKYAISL